MQSWVRVLSFPLSPHPVVEASTPYGFSFGAPVPWLSASLHRLSQSAIKSIIQWHPTSGPSKLGIDQINKGY